jgi:outer membrane biosynthesis protein TonB
MRSLRVLQDEVIYFKRLRDEDLFFPKETRMEVLIQWLLAALLGTAVAWGQAVDVPSGRSELEGGVEVLTRGPVYEAFAETITFDPAEPKPEKTKAEPKPEKPNVEPKPPKAEPKPEQPKGESNAPKE